MEVSLSLEPVSRSESVVFGAVDGDGASLPADPIASAARPWTTPLSGSDGGFDQSGEAGQVPTVSALDALLPRLLWTAYRCAVFVLWRRAGALVISDLSR